MELPIPAASAVKIGGERAYRLHRQGIHVEMPLRRSRIDALEVIAYSDGVARLDLRVSSGTYVRAVAGALGGHCRTLRRLEVGPFAADQADPDRILSPAEAVAFLQTVELTADRAAALRTGREHGDEDERYLLGAELVAVGRTVMPW